MKKPFLILFPVLAFFFSQPLAAEVLPMPDTLTLKPGAALPEGITAREIPCAILQETDQNYTVDLSRWKGISQPKTIAKALVESVTRGDSTERDFIQIKPLLAAPANAFESATEYELKYAAPLRDFVKKHPDYPKIAEIQSVLKLIESDVDLLQTGCVRIDSLKFNPSELDDADKADWKLWQEITLQGSALTLDVFAAHCRQISDNTKNLFYPLLMDAAATSASQRIAAVENKIDASDGDNAGQRQSLLTTLAEEKENATRLPHPDLTACRQAIPLYFEAVQNLRRNPPAFEAAATNLRGVLQKWSSLRSVTPLITGTILKYSELSQTQAQNGKFREAAKTLQSILPLANLPGVNKLEQFQNKIESLNLLAQQEELIATVQSAIASFDLTRADAALVDCSRFLDAHTLRDDRLTKLQKELAELRQQKTLKKTREVLVSIKVDAAAGRYKQALDAMDTIKPCLTEQSSRELSDLCLDMALQALKKARLLDAFKAVAQARSIAPDYPRAGYAFVAAFGILVLSALSGLLLLFIANAFISNLVHSQRFRMRLTALREDNFLRNSRKRHPKPVRK